MSLFNLSYVFKVILFAVIFNLLLIPVPFQFLVGQTKPTYKVVDRHCSCPEFEFTGTPGFTLKNIKESINDVEIRFTNILGHFNTRSVTVLIRNGTSFKGNYYFQRGGFSFSNWPDSVKSVDKWEPHPFAKFDIQNEGVDSALTAILNQDLLMLQSQNQFYTKTGYITPYTIEYKVGKHVGTFRFGNPDEFIQDNPEVKAFMNYGSILKIFSEMTGIFNDTVRQYDINKDN